MKLKNIPVLVVAVVIAVLLVYTNVSKSDEMSIPVDPDFSAFNMERLIDEIRTRYKLGDQTKIENIVMHVKSNKLETINFDLISKAGDNKFILIKSYYCGNCQDKKLDLETSKITVNEWLQYERLIGADLFGTTFNGIHAQIDRFALDNYLIVSSGSSEVQGQMASYFQWDDGMLLNLAAPKSEPSFTLTIKPNDKDYYIIYLNK